MTESNPIEAAKAQIAAPTTESADQHSTAASQTANKSPTESVDQSTSQTAHTSTADSATTDSAPIKTTANAYHADSASQKPAESATSNSATTDDTPIKTTTNVYHTDSINQQSAQSTESTEAAERTEPAATISDKTETSGSARSDARSSYRPGSKALDLPPPVTSSSSRSSMDDSTSSFKDSKNVSRSGPPLPVTTSASAITTRSSPPLPVTTSASDVLPVCPDPTAHRDTRLQEHASNAALYATKSGKSTRQKEDVLDANNKLSSRSKFHTIPSFPTAADTSQVPLLRSSMQMLETFPASLSSALTRLPPLILPPTWPIPTTSSSSTGSPTRPRMQVQQQL
jgi:hypothetical protein